MTDINLSKLLKDKNILILCSGSIALYKICSLISDLRKNGANVRVSLSEEAAKLVSPLTFEALSHNIVLNEDSQSWVNQEIALKDIKKEKLIPPNHISYARWADVVLLAPASANTIAKLANGIADNLMLSTAIATPSTTPFIIAPAMNTNMYNNPLTQNNLAKLKKLGYILLPTQSKILACGDNGKGALIENIEIKYALIKSIIKSTNKNTFWQDRHIVLSGGGSMEDIDCVRCISNYSSGKMASSLAIALYLYGAKIDFVTSKMPYILPKDINIHMVKSASDFEISLKKAVKIDSILFMASAIADFTPKTPSQNKIKKSSIGQTWNLELKQTSDILTSLNPAIKIGFKAESDLKEAEKNAKNLITEKNCDFAILNIIDSQTFGGDENQISIFSKNAKAQTLKDSKINLSFEILNFIAEKYDK